MSTSSLNLHLSCEWLVCVPRCLQLVRRHWYFKGTVVAVAVLAMLLVPFLLRVLLGLLSLEDLLSIVFVLLLEDED